VETLARRQGRQGGHTLNYGLFIQRRIISCRGLILFCGSPVEQAVARPPAPENRAAAAGRSAALRDIRDSLSRAVMKHILARFYC